jgi:hypothetical protein
MFATLRPRFSSSAPIERRRQPLAEGRDHAAGHEHELGLLRHGTISLAPRRRTTCARAFYRRTAPEAIETCRIAHRPAVIAASICHRRSRRDGGVFSSDPPRALADRSQADRLAAQAGCRRQPEISAVFPPPRAPARRGRRRARPVRVERGGDDRGLELGIAARGASSARCGR